MIALPKKPAVMGGRGDGDFYLVCVLWVAKNRDSLGSLRLKKLQEARNGARPGWSFSFVGWVLFPAGSWAAFPWEQASLLTTQLPQGISWATAYGPKVLGWLPLEHPELSHLMVGPQRQ